jgi:phage terminase large subunit-like protein|tara:strand:+ start:17091 stop:18446 length:1356 start_codon:yes stop_codon:yes gene_type:complete
MPANSNSTKIDKLVETEQKSIIQRLMQLEPNWYESLSDEEKIQAMWDWTLWARPKQLPPPGNWRIWLILAGRGFGKTRSGAEWVRQQVENGNAGRIALVGATAADVRDTMVEGESGLLRIFPEKDRPRYEPSKRRVTFTNGAIATAFSADEPDRLRGPNHDLAWCDEIAAWRYPDAWDQLVFGLRIGDNPRLVATTTPRPTKLIKSLVDREDCFVTTGSTYENTANLAPTFIKEVLSRYEGTRLGRQELHAEILDDVDGALWNRQLIENCRVNNYPELSRIVVGIDPAVSSGESSAETGIVAVGADANGNAYVLDDKSIKGSPVEWANAAIALYHRSSADRIVVEANQGGDMVRHTLQTVESNIPIKTVHASRGKRTRAEPVAALYEQNKVKHVGSFPQLEDQMCSWTTDSQSPDRLDALVWAVTELLVGAKLPPAVIPFGSTQVSPWEIK